MNSVGMIVWISFNVIIVIMVVVVVFVCIMVLMLMMDVNGFIMVVGSVWIGIELIIFLCGWQWWLLSSGIWVNIFGFEFSISIGLIFVWWDEDQGYDICMIECGINFVGLIGNLISVNFVMILVVFVIVFVVIIVVGLLFVFGLVGMVFIIIFVVFMGNLMFVVMCMLI